MSFKNFYSKYRIPIIVTTALLSSVVVAYAIDRVVLKKGKKMKPLKISGTYKASGCDELHAFESTHGKTIGGMNTKVNAKLKELYKQGINPEVVDVKASFDTNKMTASWEVTIDESKDGKAWVGLTSRGSSGNQSAYDRAVNASGQKPQDIQKKVAENNGDSNAELKLIKDWLFNFDSNKKILGKCPTRQLFYAYTLPSKYPPHK
jgi:hypothetical protein